MTCIVENCRPEWSVAWMQCSLAFLVRTMCAQRLLKGSSFKKKSVSGGSFIRGKSVKEELREGGVEQGGV